MPIPPDIIRRARELQSSGEFHRAVTGREPEDIDYDLLTLQCGHRSRVYFGDETPSQRKCYQCANEWIAAQMKI